MKRPLPALALALSVAALAGCATRTVFRDDFTRGTTHYVIEMEKHGSVTATGGAMDINTEGGCTVWLKRELTGPVQIEYDVIVVKAGGPWDRVSDVNCFWMASDTRASSDGAFFAVHRTGKFSDYDQLKTYYVGQGGNSNSTTRFRRYIGVKDNRPLLPEDDLKTPDVLLTPNVPMHIRLVAAGSRIEYWCNGRRLFSFNDPAPYTRGYFGFRCTWDHLRIRNLRITALPTEKH